MLFSAQVKSVTSLECSRISKEYILSGSTYSVLYTTYLKAFPFLSVKVMQSPNFSLFRDANGAKLVAL